MPKLTFAQSEAIANADAQLNKAGLPLYSTLAMRSVWIEGTPPESVDAAWLRLVSDFEGEEVASVVLGVTDMAGVWSISGDWKGESFTNAVDELITHWMPYAVPSAKI